MNPDRKNEKTMTRKKSEDGYLPLMIAAGDRYYDPAAKLLLLPMGGYRNVHTEHLDDTPRHAVRESLYYALALLETDVPGVLPRAEALIDGALALQQTADPEAETYGLWPYFLEDPVPVWRWPDLNWADFNGMTLLLIWHRHRARLTARLTAEIEAAIHRAAICIRRRNVDLNYTNIAIKGTFVALSAAEIAGDAEMLSYALDRLARLRDTVAGAETFAEYNSPTYAAISLAGLHAIRGYAAHPGVPALVEPMLERFWKEIAERFHPETRELAGPHARAYSTTLNEAPALLGTLIEKASRGAVRYGVAPKRDGKAAEEFGALYACVLDVEAPAAAVERLTAAASEARQVSERVQTGPDRAPRVLTTWMEPAFCLGTVSFQDGWEQRHNLIAYWKSTEGRIGSLSHRYLRDDRPCCSGYFVSRQRCGGVAAGAFLAAYADHHVSIPTEGTVCAFLGPVIELDAAGEHPRVSVEGETLADGSAMPLPAGRVVRIELKAVTLEFELTLHAVDPAPKTEPRIERIAADRLRIVLPHYEGERKAIRWLDFKRAASTYALRMAATDARPTISAGLTVDVPCETPASQAEAEAWGLENSEAMPVSGNKTRVG